MIFEQSTLHGNATVTSEVTTKNRYTRSETTLGRGRDARVYEGFDRINKVKVAMKILPKSIRNDEHKEELMLRYRNEVEILKRLDHKGVIGLIDYYEEPDQATIVLEYADGGDLSVRMLALQRLDEDAAKTVTGNLIEALKHIHARNIVHRDLRLENILVKSTSNVVDVMIADFGSAAHCMGNHLTNPVGTTYYVAPEILLGIPYGKGVDIWSLGVIIYVMLHGVLPFLHEDLNLLFEKIMTAQFSFKENEVALSTEVKDLLSLILVPDSSRRLSLDEISAHSWFTDSIRPAFDQQLTNLDIPNKNHFRME